MTQTAMQKLSLVSMLILASAVGAAASAAEAPKTLANVDKDGVILEGHDVVAYWTEKKPVQGTKEFQSTHEGAIYLFASAENKAAFDADPAHYAPQYGAFCAYATSLGKLRPVDVTIFHWVDGRLMFQHTRKALESFLKNTERNTQKADEKWPKLVEKKAGKFKPGQFDKPAAR